MFKNRLLILAEHLEKIAKQKKPKRTFSMHRWWNPQYNSGGQCRTAACAFGEATTIRAFRKFGLSRTEHGTPVFKGDHGTDAAAKFFHISSPQAHGLFNPSYYPSATLIKPIEVATRIRELVAGKQL